MVAGIAVGGAGITSMPNLGKEKLDSILDIQSWFTSTWVMSRGDRSMHLTDVTVNINLWYKNSCMVTICID